EGVESSEKLPRPPQRENSRRAVMILLVSPRSAKWKHRIPLSLLSLAAVLEGRYECEIVDGNLESDLESKLTRMIRATNAKVVAFSVMPGPQLQEAIPVTRYLRQLFPKLTIVWGGYF